MRIPLILGSQRTNSNSAGLAEWLVDHASKSNTKLSLDSSTAVPYHPVSESVIAAAITRSQDYADPLIRAWSELVRSSPAIVIITPQYNWGYPGGIKNAIDHLFNEWRGKPVLLVTFGGHGGGKCAEKLGDVIAGGVKAKLVETVQITIPGEYIRTGARVHKEEGAIVTDGESAKPSAWPEFLDKYENQLEEALQKLERVILENEKEADERKPAH